jgi:type I restriction enzyme M protein
VTRAEIEAKNYDLKAVNPNIEVEEDNRTPEDLLSFIEEKAQEVAAALAVLQR